MFMLIASSLAIVFALYTLLKKFVLEPSFIDMEGRYVFVTGCDSGFGRLLVQDLLKRNCNVFAGCFTENGKEFLGKRASEIGGGKVYPLSIDITKDESVDAAHIYVRDVLSQNNATLWGLVNNAGVFSIFGPDDWCSVDEYRHSLEVNCLGAIRVCHKFVPMLKHSRGRIVSMASTAGRLHGQFVAPYCVGKFAVEAYMDCLRYELRHWGVSVHILEPGAFKTELLNERAQQQRVERIWNQLPESVKLEYGETYKNNFLKAWSIGVGMVANPNLQWVVDNYVHALASRWPRLRYYTGWDAILAFIPLSLAPTWVQDTVLGAMYALQPGPPLNPEALRNKKRV